MSDEEGTSYFFTDHDMDNLEWGGTIIGILYPTALYRAAFFSLVSLCYTLFLSFTDPSDENYGHFKDDKHQGQLINLIRLSTLINQDVATRIIPALDPEEFGKPTVFIKMDIEGSEVEVLHDMILQESFAHVDVIQVEFHEFIAMGDRKRATGLLRSFTQDYARFYSLIKPHAIEILDVDDESYYLSNFTLPTC